MPLPADPTPHRKEFASVATPKVSATHYTMAMRAYDIMSIYASKSPTEAIQMMAETFRNIEHNNK